MRYSFGGHTECRSYEVIEASQALKIVSEVGGFCREALRVW